MNIPFGHQRLYNFFKFEGSLELITALHISSGKASDETDAPFIRTFGGVPYIPGSSLRGAIRADLERIVGSVGNVAGLRCCTLFEQGNCANKLRDFIRTLDDNDSAKEDRIVDFLRQRLCDVCLLFGTPDYASRLAIEDALPIPKAAGSPKGRIRDGVGINRDTGAAHEGVKFDYEAIDPQGEGPLFSFTMTAENVTDRDKKLITLILKLLRQGIQVGGKRAAGLGKIRLKAVEGAEMAEGLQAYCHITGFTDPMSIWKSLIAGQPEVYKPLTWEEVI